jgi:hypothetical protein
MRKKERWRRIKGFKYYKVSDTGRVKSLTREVYDSLRDVYVTRKGKILAAGRTASGYYTVSLCKDGKSKTFNIHHLVLNAFVGIRKEGFECNHKNGLKCDNSLRNLKWCTKSKNVKHAYKKGLRLPHYGEKHPNCTLPRSKVEEIREIRETTLLPYTEIGALLGVTPSHVQRICKGTARKNG